MYTINNVRENKSKINNHLEIFNSETRQNFLLMNLRDSLVSELKDAYSRYIQALIQQEENESKIHNIGVKPCISFNKDNYDYSTIKALYKLRLYDSHKNSLEHISDEQNKIKIILPSIRAISSIFWILSGSKKKNESIANANILGEYIIKDYGKLLSAIDNQISKIDENQLFKDFYENTSEYLDILNKIKIAKVYIENDPQKPDFFLLNSLSDKLNKSHDILTSFSSLSSTYKENIIKKANSLLLHEVNSTLNTISVDELKKYVKRISISSLKEAGFNTVFDVVCCSEWNLSNIRGISENGAHELKKASNAINEETTKNTKIKLNEDTKTSQSTELLKSLYLYNQFLPFAKKADDLNKIYELNIKTSHDYLGSSQNSIKWLQSNFETKQNIFNASKIIFNGVTTNYLEEIDNLLYQKNEAESQPTDEKVWTNFSKNSSIYFAILDELCPGLFGNDDLFYGLPEELALEIQDECIFPEGLLVTLRRYQEWGVKYILHQKSVLLGDEMGLGKTIQSIATMVSLKNVGAKFFLVICPAAVMINWCREIEQHSKLKAIKIHGTSKISSFKKWLKTGGVAVTTYETTKFLNSEKEFQLDFLIVDEAHYIKNPDAQRTKNVIEIGKKAQRKLYLTGTALENKVDEMIELVKQLNPSIASQIKHLTYLAQAESFRLKVAPVYYRRKREDVLTELPDLIEKDAWCSLKEYEKEVYENAILSRRSYPFIRRVSWHIDDLRYSSKAQRLLEIIETAKNQNRKIIVFSYFLDTIEKISNYLGSKCLIPINGSMPSQKRQEIIDEFNQSPPGTVLLGQITATGTGLNIQTASVVVITEPQFKPSIENQAIARAYRMGQTRNVLVYRLLCENTVDERIRDLLYSKQQIFDAFADESVAAQANQEIDDSKFKNIIEEEIARIKKEKGVI